MSTADRPARVASLPPLAEGQRMDREEFHARYEAMPPGTWAELIGGVVHMSSPVGYNHGHSHVPVLVWLSYYVENTPGVEAADNASTALGPDSEPQPDASLQISERSGGQSFVEDNLLRGAPELIVEVSHSSMGLDLGAKLADYEQAGVLEYVVRTLEPAEVRWHVLQGGRLAAIPPDADGLHRSRAFPGLWLDPAALLAGDARRLRAVVDLGLATAEHAAFVARLAAARRGG